MLTSKQRAYLGGCASTMDPIFHIGKASLTPEIITALDEALENGALGISGGSGGKDRRTAIKKYKALIFMHKL